MKAKLLLFITLFISLTCAANKNANNLVLLTKDGTKAVFVLSEQPKVLFSGNTIIISNMGIESYYSLKDIACFYYEESVNTSANEINVHDKLFRIDGESIVFSQLKANSKISIISPNGIILLQETVNKDGYYTFPLSGLTSGMYIISINGTTFKISKK